MRQYGKLRPPVHVKVRVDSRYERLLRFRIGIKGCAGNSLPSADLLVDQIFIKKCGCRASDSAFVRYSETCDSFPDNRLRSPDDVQYYAKTVIPRDFRIARDGGTRFRVQNSPTQSLSKGSLVCLLIEETAK